MIHNLDNVEEAGWAGELSALRKMAFAGGRGYWRQDSRGSSEHRQPISRRQDTPLGVGVYRHPSSAELREAVATMPGPATGGGAGVLLDGGSGKSHRKAKAGRKADKRKTAEQKKKGTLDQAKAARQNPRAFAFQSAGKAKRNQSRSSEKDQRRMHAPMMERAVDEPPPLMVLVHGPPGAGKTIIIKKEEANHFCGVPSGSEWNESCLKLLLRLLQLSQLSEAVQLDAAKYADLVLLMIDGSFGFEMETFEFLNLLQVWAALCF
eukprot:gene24733-10369_t